MKVVVAGSTGVLGREVVGQLVAQGCEVAAIVRDPDSLAHLRSQGVVALRGDILDRESTVEAVRRAGRGIDAVLHLATAIPKVPSAPGAWMLNDQVRTKGARNLLDAAIGAGADLYIQQSVTRLYGDHGANWIDESAPVADALPVHLRSAAEMEGLVAAAQGIRRIVLRGGEFYGAGTVTESLLEAARSGELRLDGEGAHFMSLVHPTDMARAVVLALRVPESYAVLNVVDDEPVQQSTFYSAICSLLNLSHQPLSGEAMTIVPSRRCSNQAVRSWGFAPKYPSYREGLAHAIACQAARPITTT